MNISQAFKNHFIGTMPLPLAAKDMLDEVVFPHILPYDSSSIPKCFNQYVHNVIVEGYKKHHFQSPKLDKALNSTLVDLCGEFVFQPDGFCKFIIQGESWDNAAVVESCIEEFVSNFHAESQHPLIDHFNACLKDEPFKDLSIAKHTLSIHQGQKSLKDQYKDFMLALEYECIAEVLEQGSIPLPDYDAVRFKEYMLNLMMVAHEDLDYPIAT